MAETKESRAKRHEAETAAMREEAKRLLAQIEEGYETVGRLDLLNGIRDLRGAAHYLRRG